MTEQNAPERIFASIGPREYDIDARHYKEGDDFYEYVRADLYDAAIRREKALLASNDEDRKGLVEAASLRHRLKVMTAIAKAAHNEAIEAVENALSDAEFGEPVLRRIRALRREPRK